MGITNSVAAAGLNAIVDSVDNGSAAGKLKIRATAYGTVLVTFTFSDPAFGNATTASPSVATAASLPKTATAAATGTAGSFQVTDSDDNVIWQATGAGAVGTSGALVVISSTSITSGQSIDLTACTLSFPTALVGEA